MRAPFPRALNCALALTSTSLLAACPDPAPTVAPDIFVDQLGEAVPFASPEQKATFARGKEVALRRFTPATGLGPDFNLVSCSGCHERPTVGGSASRYRDFLLVGQTLPDGSYTPLGKNGVQDQYDTAGHRVPTPETANALAVRSPIPFFGVGLLAAISDEVILANADPDDRDHDGISGRPNYDRGFVGRFGRKSQTVSIEGFLRGPLFNHVGITSNPLPNARKALLPVPSALPETDTLNAALAIFTAPQAAAPDEPTLDDDAAPDPELAEDDLFDLVSFAMLMAPPRPDPLDATTTRGQRLFAEIQCAACHVPALEGPRGLIPAYSDLLLHDMGPDLADGVPMKVATGSEFRTQPLWGVVAVGPYLHDGRADTLDDAIRLHGGEGQASRDRYAALGDVDRQAVLAFLESLGGRAQASVGLLPPDAPIPAPGTLGGPAATLDAPSAERFLAGREVFDRDVYRTEGLGPVFNGDACRSCHFDPIIGGAGPNDVNVVRHGRLIDGVFTAPPFGTISHHQETAGVRPPYWPDANVDEQRQTPPLFGAGLIDAIAESTILAAQDPDDLDHDGISGRAHLLPDGRIGRFGWKAQVPSLAEFARDASSAELGLSLPLQPSLSFGYERDDDDVPDPEISTADLEDLVFFMASLAAPARHATDATLEAQGEALFAQVGCAACHTPSLPSARGEVALYSDLLLHDVAAADFRGIGDGDAQPREFRTPPLWGLHTSGPWMHDGGAATLEEAIALHFAEADTSRLAFLALNASEREALLAFLASL